MFTDRKEALEAEALELTPTSTGQAAAASTVVARRARDKDDLAELLCALGLPRGEDDLVRLLPHLPTTDTPTTGAPMPDKAFTAVAASMLSLSYLPSMGLSWSFVRSAGPGVPGMAVSLSLLDGSKNLAARSPATTRPLIGIRDSIAL